MSLAPDRSPAAYAKYLAGYIRDPSTIRARTMEQFGRSPSIERIAYWRGEVERLKAVPHNTYLTDRWDGTKYDLPKGRTPLPAKPTVLPARAPAVVVSPTFALPPWRVGVLGAGEIISAIAASFGLTRERVTGQSRDSYTCMVRALIATLLAERGNSTPQVGKWLGRDHSSIVHARKMLPIYIKRLPALGEAYAHYRREWGLSA
jgi:hypothetical protein